MPKCSLVFLFAMIGCGGDSIPPLPVCEDVTPEVCESDPSADPVCCPQPSWAPVIRPDDGDVDLTAIDVAGTLRVVPLRDLNGDGVGELGVVADDLHVRNGADGLVLGSFSADLGRQMASGGDVDGDGLTDLVVGDGDKRWLFHGSTLANGGTFGGDDAAASFTGFEGREILAVGGGGDVTGDGRDDLVMSEYNKKDSGRSNEEIRVVPGKSIGVGNHNLGDFDSAFGAVVDGRGKQSLTIMGDFDGDGLADIAAGAVRNFAAVHPSNNLGGGPFGGLSDKEVHLTECHPGEECPDGAWVGAVGDTDLDGLDDLIVTRFPQDSAWVIPGNALDSDLYKTKAFGGTMAEAREIRGASDLAAAGDFDGNGMFDLIATAPDGQIWLIGGHQLGDAALSLPGSIAEFEASGASVVSHALDGFGSGAKAASVGDFDGNGLDDIAVWNDTTLYILKAWPVESP